MPIDIVCSQQTHQSFNSSKISFVNKPAGSPKFYTARTLSYTGDRQLCIVSRGQTAIFLLYFSRPHTKEKQRSGHARLSYVVVSAGRESTAGIPGGTETAGVYIQMFHDTMKQYVQYIVMFMLTLLLSVTITTMVISSQDWVIYESMRAVILANWRFRVCLVNGVQYVILDLMTMLQMLHVDNQDMYSPVKSTLTTSM